MAAFPSSVKTFTTKENVVHVVDADHPNTSEAEITAIESILGTMPHQSLARATTYVSVAARLEDIEADYRRLDQPEPHAGLTGLAGDDHTQYMRTDGTRAFSAMTNIAAVPGASAIGDTPTEGTAMRLARSDHKHGVTAAAPVASAVADTQAAGTAATYSRSDHRHAREAFGAVSDGTAYGGAAADGTAVTVARSDHYHGTPNLATGVGGTPVNQDYGDAAAPGTGTVAARSDHRHGMPALASTAPVTQVLGDAAAVGIGTTPARADHRHGMPALATTVTDERTWGIAPAVGTSPIPARQDHTHGSPDATLTGPSGVVAMWPTNTPPVGWLICDGRTDLLIATYPVLAAILGTQYGGNGTTTFGIPNLKGKVVVGRDAGDTDWDVLGETRGTKTHTLTAAEMPVHNHGVTVDGNNFNTAGRNAGHVHGSSDAGTHSHSFYPGWGSGADIVMVSVGGPNNYRISDADDPAQGPYLTFGRAYDSGNHNHGNTGGENVDHAHNANHGHSASSGNAGSGSAHNNIQPSLVLNYIIKT